MNNSAEVIDNYVSVRDSIRTERERLANDVSTLQKRLAAVEQRSELGFDPAYSRTAATIKRQLTAANEAVALFDTKQQGLHAAQTGSAAKAAQAQAQNAAKLFEEKLTAFAAAASMLKAKTAALADALQIHEPGLWPSRGSVDEAIRSRIIDVLGSTANVKLPSYGTSGKVAKSLSTRFSMETK